ncbi:MAG: quinol:electron acceptor oxidoreductase subunit ActD [Anaerolineae bacterium]
MADTFLLGLFHEATPTADAIDALRKLGIPDPDITVMTSIPYSAEMLGRRSVYERLVPIALVGALSGFVLAMLLLVGTPLLYPLNVGGQPLIPGPPTIIITFEMVMLGAMIATFMGIIAEIWFPRLGSHVYDVRISEGHIGVLARVPNDLVDQAEQALTAQGAHHFQRVTGRSGPGMFTRRSRLQRWREEGGDKTLYWTRWLVLGGLITVPGLVALAAAYSVFFLPIPNQMVEQISQGYEYGPRLAAPAASVPIQGADLLGCQPATQGTGLTSCIPATQPIPSSPESIARGKAFYGITCRTCHGEAGNQGEKTLVGAQFKAKGAAPADLTSDLVQSLSDQDLYVVITNGFVQMPPMRENLLPADRWDVINYVRTLKK